MRKALGLCFLLMLRVSLLANHIVGGEIEFVYLSDGLYRINLIQYFDEAQDLNAGAEAAIQVYIFSNTTGEIVSTHVLLRQSVELVNYTNVECSIEELQTSRVFYTTDVALDPRDYQDPEGYYIQWERCCRNVVISNIVNPGNTGMNYALEIPPLMKDGEIFRNSSPQLFQPLSDYACINQLFYIDFTGVDPDGDSLAYFLAVPLNSATSGALPIPQKKPYIPIQFLPGFSLDNMVPGSPPLRISNEGRLTVNPTQTGLFVFSVRVEEYRDNVKIGEAIRDFQMLVIDGCEPPDPPVVDIRIPDDDSFDPSVNTLTYNASDVEKCFEFIVENISPNETISLRAEGVNFDEDLDEIFQLNQIPVDGADQLIIETCIPDCPPIRDGPFILDLIAADDACPLPQQDTLRLFIQVEPPPNQKPVIAETLGTIIETEDNDPVFMENISATDADGDELEFSLLLANGESPAQFGFDLINTTGGAGVVQSTLVWDTDCVLYDFADTNEFEVMLLASDNDICDVPGDTLTFSARVILPPNTNPEISRTLNLPQELFLGQQYQKTITATDADGDMLNLIFVAGNFDAQTYSASFVPVAGAGSVSSVFSWDLTCNASIYQDGQAFELLFIADDEDRCQLKNFDTLRQVVTVRYPENESPSFSAIDQFRSVRVNEQISINLEASDLDGDEITIDFASGFRQPSSSTLSFDRVSDMGSVSGRLTWQPECSLLRLNQNSSIQEVFLEVRDNACPIPNVDTLKLTFEIFNDAEQFG
ncbi:MAG: hypothetical protein AAF789_05655, partial [Bacteroidota bacterium]